MALRFRRTIRLAPGLRLNLGKKSASVRVGGKNVGYTVGSKGRTASASIPGTGLGVTDRRGGGADLSWPRILMWLGVGVVLLVVVLWLVAGLGAS